MKVFLVGQRGIPANNYYDHRERRAEALARWATERGYQVYVAAEATYGARHLSTWQGADIVPVKGILGTFGYALRLAWRMWRVQPDVVHVQGWQAARWVRLWRLVVPNATLLWTIPNIPRERGEDYEAVLRKGERIFDRMTTPSREAQYLLLDHYQARVQYIPDGFSEAVDDIPVSQWDLRKGQYAVVTATSEKDLEWICRAYDRLSTKKNLVVFHPKTKKIMALRRKYDFLQVIEVLSERSYHSLLRQAAVVIAASPYGLTEPLLQAMSATRAVVSVNHPLNEEVLGASGQIVLQGDDYALEEALESVITKPKKQQKWGKKAAKRAAGHFTWRRVLAEYARIYQLRAPRAVPMDSLVRHRQKA